MTSIDSPLGMVLVDNGENPPAPGLDREAVVIGHVHDGEFLIVEFVADATTAVFDVAGRHTVPLNRDRAATAGFLQAFADYLRSAGPSSGPRVLTADQAAERLAAFRAGKIAPPPPPTAAALPHSVRVRNLLRALRRIDTQAATSPGSWWSGAIEQAKDDLI
ncbi:hypothetical protein [Microbacterium sp. GXS0129]|uniref:hypothetical protein n=1 Tax=Microbacterium sp. GXS0129 TaxID=3377836 RepID=UPI003839F87A